MTVRGRSYFTLRSIGEPPGGSCTENHFVHVDMQRPLADGWARMTMQSCPARLISWPRNPCEGPRTTSTHALRTNILATPPDADWRPTF